MTTGERFALCVGINAYEGPVSGLAGCVNAAQDWADALRARGFNATTLLDEQATRRGILDGLAGLMERAGYGDTVLFTFSGHGTWMLDEDGDEADGRDEALCPHDVMGGVIVDDDLHALFSDRRRGVRVVMVSDSCHSGTVMRFADLAQSDTRDRVRFLEPGVFLGRAAARRAQAVEAAPVRGVIRPFGGVLLSGCADPEFSFDAWFGGRANGAFSYVALRALAQLKPGGRYRDWHGLIRAQLPSRQYPPRARRSAAAARRRPGRYRANPALGKS
jgi:uncharacterized caspase-like protein